MNDRFNMYRDLEVHVALQCKIVAERRRMPQTPLHLQKGSCTWGLYDQSACALAYASVRFNEIFDTDARKKLSYERDDGLIASMIDLISESVDTMRFTIDYVMGRSTTETAMGSPLNRVEVDGLQRHVHGDDAAVWEHQICSHLLYCETLVSKLAKLRSALRHAALIKHWFSEDAMSKQRRNEVASDVLSSDEIVFQKMPQHFDVV